MGVGPQVVLVWRERGQRTLGRAPIAVSLVDQLRVRTTPYPFPPPDYKETPSIPPGSSFKSNHSFHQLRLFLTLHHFDFSPPLEQGTRNT